FPEGYDNSRELIIDPELIFSTYSGATSRNFGMTATYDSQGNAYAGGIVFGPGYPVDTLSADSTFNGGSADVAISKYSSDGQSLMYTTFYGGNRNEMVHSMVANSNDELIFYGTTSSTDIP